MKILTKIEELFLFGLSLILFSRLDYGWGASRYAILFLSPDLSMLGHSSPDRVFGYGFKYPDAFQNTH